MTREPRTLVKERAFVERVAYKYADHCSAHERIVRELVVRTFEPFSRGGVALEMGCSSGLMTWLLAPRFAKLDVMDGARHFLNAVKALNLPNVQLIHGLFEDLDVRSRYDAIFATFVLEHVAHLSLVLKNARRALKPSGRFFVVVPNAFGLSRLLACQMGLLSDPEALTPNDKKHGHRRVFNRLTLNCCLESAGFRIIAQGGILLKPLADFQMDRLLELGILGREHMEGLYRLGLMFPDLAAYIYAVCESQVR